MTGKVKPYAVLLTRTSPTIRTRGMAHIQKGLVEAGIPVLQTELNERDAFKAIFSFQQTLDGLNPTEVANLDKARANVEQLLAEILSKLAPEQGRDELAAEVTLADILAELQPEQGRGELESGKSEITTDQARAA
jgi:chromosome partitioning protein